MKSRAYGQVFRPDAAARALAKKLRQKRSRLRRVSRATNSRGSVSSQSVRSLLDWKPRGGALVDLGQHSARLGFSHWRVIPNFWRGITRFADRFSNKPVARFQVWLERRIQVDGPVLFPQATEWQTLRRPYGTPVRRRKGCVSLCVPSSCYRYRPNQKSL